MFLFRRIRLKKRLSDIKLIICDVDGVLTDGKIGYDKNGEAIKFFNEKDSSGIKMALHSGLKVAIVSGRDSLVAKKKAEELGIKTAVFGVKKKLKTIKEIINTLDVKREEVMFIGDDLIDFQAVEYVGVGVAVKDAHFMLKKIADYITKAKGGAGAVREIIDLILLYQNKYKQGMSRYIYEED